MVSCTFPNNKRMKIVKFSLHLLEAQQAVVKLKNWVSFVLLQLREKWWIWKEGVLHPWSVEKDPTVVAVSVLCRTLLCNLFHLRSIYCLARSWFSYLFLLTLCSMSPPFFRKNPHIQLTDLVHLSTLQTNSCSVETGTSIWGCTQQGLLPGNLVCPWMVSHSLEKQLFPFLIKKPQWCAWNFTFL